MIAKWKKDSDERLKAIKKNKNRWIDNERYTLSPFKIEEHSVKSRVLF